MKKAAAAIILIMSWAAWGGAPKYVFMFVGSGMGEEQVKAAAIYAGGAPGSLNFEKFPYRESVAVKCAETGAPDAAAAATSLATGLVVNRGVISMGIPGEVKDKDPETVLEYSRDRLNKSTGIVTDSFLTDAAAAAFGAHQPKRENHNEIAVDYLQKVRPNVLFGGGGMGMSKEAAENAGYKLVTNRQELDGLNYERVMRVCGFFGEGTMGYAAGRKEELPRLAEMTAAAIRILEKDADGFFLMVNASNIGRAGVENDLSASVAEVFELQKAVQVAVEWAKDPNETLILVTGDVEVGGLKVTMNNGHGKLPAVTWAGKETTEAKVPVYAWGLNSQMVQRAPSTQAMCVVATFDPKIPLPRSRWKSVIAVGLFALMAIMVILTRGGNKIKDI
jgi:alkaline phosphatase